MSAQSIVSQCFLLALTLLFVGLKLSGHIDWSWWWVISPLWIPALAVVCILVLCWLVIFIAWLGRW